MIFNFITALLLQGFFTSPRISSDTTNDWNIQDNSKKVAEPPNVWQVLLDIDDNGQNETIVIKSYSGFLGDQNTEIYIDSDEKPAVTEVGYFRTIQTNKMDPSNHYILQLQLQTGQSLNTLFYIYNKGELEKVPVSTEKPSSWHGIISRNYPELKDIDNDGVPELLAYYNFLHDLSRKVEVYKFTDSAFQKIMEYEESNPDKYL